MCFPSRNFLRTWTKPALVMFSDQDPITRGLDKFFLGLLPDAKQHTVHGASHFLQETHGEECADMIVQFLDNQL